MLILFSSIPFFCFTIKLHIFFLQLKQMSCFNIEFKAFCQTKFGQKVCICGNLAQLGVWVPAEGLMLQTNKHKYPIWNHTRPIAIKEGFQIQFKLCILNSLNELVRWEQIHGNRCFSPKNESKGSLMIEFSESDASMIYKNTKNSTPPLMQVHNLRKGTQQVLNQLASDSSSNKQMWRQHEFLEQEQDSLILTQFTKQLIRTIASQKEESMGILQHQPKMQQHHFQFGSYNNHFYNTHYIFTDKIPDKSPSLDVAPEKIIFISYESMDNFQLDHTEQVSIFHVVGCKSEDLISTVRDIMERWMKISNKNIRGIINVYEDNFMSKETVTELIKAGVNNFLTCNFETADQVLQAMKLSHYSIIFQEKDVFVANKQQQQLIKLCITTFTAEEFIRSKEHIIDQITPKLMKGYYFKFQDQRFQSRLNECLSICRMNKSQLLIILHLKKLQQLQNKTILDLVHLSSLRFKVIVFVVIEQRFNRNIQHKIPVAKNNVIFLNTYGDIYANSNQPIDIFYFIEINKSKFEENQKIILEELAIGIKTSYKKNSKLIIEFHRNKIGEIMREKSLKLIRDVNNKSIAKLIGEINNERLELYPFCLHVSFLYKVILKTFANRLKNNEKAMVINIDGSNFKTSEYLEIPEGREINIKFLPFCLNHFLELRSAYASNPITEDQLVKMIEMISDQYYDAFNSKKTQILSEIKNIR